MDPHREGQVRHQPRRMLSIREMLDDGDRVPAGQELPAIPGLVSTAADRGDSPSLAADSQMNHAPYTSGAAAVHQIPLEHGTYVTHRYHHTREVPRRYNPYSLLPPLQLGPRTDINQAVSDALASLPEPEPEAEADRNVMVLDALTPQVGVESRPDRNTGVPEVKGAHCCMLCLEHFTTDEIIYKCTRCKSGQCCAPCLKGWFFDACKNESKMPPKCCTIIPLSAVSKLMTASEIELYKAKYEEWNTPDRLYCPIPSCSTFIPPRLFEENSTSHETEIQHKKSQVEAPVQEEAEETKPQHMEHDLQDPSQHWTIPDKTLRPDVACPACSTSICTKCRSVSHQDACSGNDLDSDLQAVLDKWKIKRCPKCRAGVRKMFGCYHVECRCGAHFCWGCMRSMIQCEGNCDDENSENDSMGDHAEDDLDFQAGFYDGDGYDFGEEPRDSVVEMWACHHAWSRPRTLNSTTHASQSLLECHRCFRVVKRPENNQVAQEETLESLKAASEPWQCFSGHITCAQCPKVPPRWRSDDVSRMWSCDCRNAVCEICDMAAAAKQKAANDEKAWECRCSMVVCGACKNLV